ncbi:hypothetical protein [Limnofasciculus baicalensis]|uniref:Uncharacterized protein n=1 Tax=Limnofasciculus baicalensis BBK-W-15 TaxID=2699891 RepID=A0AAE3GNF1_9CYAN|nr:hypothetical protein [Limnofasciculus baicalensis]MCP2727594.1 hypothetical protein [Limnofasciculus baicalensis BBK-W-15]
MARYIEFTTDTENGEAILVEVDKEEVSPPQGLVKAGIKDKLQCTVAIAQKTFSEAVKSAIKMNVQTFTDCGWVIFYELAYLNRLLISSQSHFLDLASPQKSV